jgi:hypothetical protein
MEVFLMNMKKVVSKCAATLSAVAIMGSTAAGFVPATFANVGNVIVASAAELSDFEYDGTYLTGDLYCAVGSSFTMEVTLGTKDKQYGTDGFTYEWYYSSSATKGTNKVDQFNWTKLNYTTKAITVNMTSAMDGCHIYAVKVNKTTGEKTQTPMRTICSVKANLQLGTTSTSTSNGATYVNVPVYLSNLTNRQISAGTIMVSVDKNVFADASFSFAASGLEGLDSFANGVYTNAFFNASTPATLSSNNLLGTLKLKVKSGATYNGSKITMVIDKPTLTGDSISGNRVYGINTASVVVGQTPVTTNTVPQNFRAVTNAQYHQIQFVWDKVQGADRYGIAVKLAGKWRVQTSNITTNSYITPKNLTPGMTYQVAVAARVNGKWDTNGAIKNAITVTVK